MYIIPLVEFHQRVLSTFETKDGAVGATIAVPEEEDEIHGSHVVPSHIFKVLVAVSIHSSPRVLPSAPGGPEAPALGDVVPTEQGPTLNKVVPVSSAKKKPGSAALIFTAGWPDIKRVGSGRFFRTLDRRI